MISQQFAHQFFYDNDFNAYANNGNMSYNNGKFYSYGTIIGKVISNKHGKTLLISHNNFSTTTAKHISYLRNACPFDTISVPVDWYQSDITPERLVTDITSTLDSIFAAGLNTKSNRDEYSTYLNSLEKLNARNIIPASKRAINKYKKIWEEHTDPQVLAKERAAKATKTREENARLAKELEAVLSSHSYLEQIKLAYDTAQRDNKISNKLKKHLNPGGDLSFVWPYPNGYYTSQSVHMDTQVVHIALKLYKAGKLKHGMTIGNFTVLTINPDFIKVGCHKIPIKNVNALIEEANI